MIDLYLDRGTMFALVDSSFNCETIGICVVTDEGYSTLEIKNIAVEPDYQNMGYGKTLIDLICEEYKDDYRCVQVGTGDIPWIISFYEKCGFHRSHRIINFFTDNYDHPMYENGIQLIDMVCLIKELSKE